MDVFELRNKLIGDYSTYVRSFIQIRDPLIGAYVDQELGEGAFWPEPRVGLNPSFAPGRSIEQLVSDHVLHSDASRIFRIDKDKEARGDGVSRPIRLHAHQDQAILVAQTRKPYVLTTGTGSGKSLAYMIPIVDRILKSGSGKGIRAIAVYPMNALANSQEGELKKFLGFGYPAEQPPVTFRRYTGQETREQRQQILASPPDIILTNYVMLELLLTRVWEKDLIEAAQGLEFLVLDEMHTYRGRQGADVALLVRRVREACNSLTMQCIGTSATLATSGTYDEQRAQVA
jgi:ATP-dependent helicase YprA (DUF1998 family)